MKHSHTVARALLLGGGLAVAANLALAQRAPKYPVTAAQRATATQVAQAGVPLSELAPNAPDEYVVRRGDTLWDISGKFLRSPWHWPQLWGMNMAQIRNPNLIYPGQRLVLDRSNGRAVLRLARQIGGEIPTVHLSPSNRAEMLDANPLPTLKPNLIEPFLTEPIVADTADFFENAPRIVATPEESRELVGAGDYAYVRSSDKTPLLMQPGTTQRFRVFRGSTPMIDPVTHKVLGYEGHFVGVAELVRGEGQTEDDTTGADINPDAPGDSYPVPTPGTADSDAQAASQTIPVAAKINIISSKEEIGVGDHLIPEPPRQFRSYVPRAPSVPVDATVISIYGDAINYAGQSQVVAINRGTEEGIEDGDVLVLLSNGSKIRDKTVSERGELIKLPDERNGLGMVFLTFTHVSYALVMEIVRPLQIGDKLTNPPQ